MNRKKHIFFDFDGMKFDTIPKQVEYLNQRYGLNLTVDDHTDGLFLDEILNKHLPADKHVTRIDAYRDVSKYFLESHEWHEGIMPMEGMAETLEALSKEYVLWTVTARQIGGIDVIKQVLDRHVPNCIEDIHCVWRYQDGDFKAVSKREFIESIDGEKVGFLDDSPSEVEQIQDIVPSWLFDPTGKHDSNTKIKNRVRSWREIKGLFLKNPDN
ncbi:MAG: hypothetical protein JWM20_910 [Patescibacteria group bacterium]|nr:hypothetical protein [Patescibacteria group bacterium]